MIRFVFLLCAALGLTDEQSSFAQTRPSEDALTKTIKFQSGYYDQDDNPIAGDSLPREVSLRLSFIAGNLSGKVTTPSISSITVHVGETTTLDLANIRATAEQSAAVLTREATEAGLVTRPRETRIARLATTVSHPETKKGVGLTVFRRLATHESLIMVYFDRPCHLSGVVHARGAEVKYDVNVDKAGLRLLKIVKESSTRYGVTGSKTPEDMSLRIVPRIGTP